jgi:hypothetical protein
MTNNTGGFNAMSNILKGVKLDENKQRRIAHEWQDYAYRLALELEDTAHTSLYMRLCKNTPRFILEEARCSIKDNLNVRNKGRLFMWKVKEIRDKSKRAGERKFDILK